MGWREILIENQRDKRDKSPQAHPRHPFCPYCHHDLGIENQGSEATKPDTIAVPAYFNEPEREYFLNLVDFMESPKHRMNRETAEREAKAIVDQYREMKKARGDEE